MVSREKLIVCRIDRLVIDDFVIQYTPFERFDLIAIIYITKKKIKIQILIDIYIKRYHLEYIVALSKTFQD